MTMATMATMGLATTIPVYHEEHVRNASGRAPPLIQGAGMMSHCSMRFVSYLILPARGFTHATQLIRRMARPKTQAFPDTLALRLCSTQLPMLKTARIHASSHSQNSCMLRPRSDVDALMFRFACVQTHAQSESLFRDHSTPRPWVLWPAHIPTQSRADPTWTRPAQGLTRTESPGLPPPRAGAHSHRVTWTPPGVTPAEGTHGPPQGPSTTREAVCLH